MPSSADFPHSHQSRAINRGTELDRAALSPFRQHTDHLAPEMRPLEHVDAALQHANRFRSVDPAWGLDKQLVSLERRPYASALLSCAENAARAAGVLIRKAYEENAGSSFDTKLNVTDPVTETDRRCEDLIIEMIRERFSGHDFLAEESAPAGQDLSSLLTEDPTWIIDPVDGTTNFVHGIKSGVGVSIACYVCKEPVAACVYLPISDEMFTATTRGGAFLNGARIRTSDCQALNRACVATEAGYDRSPEGVAQQMARLQGLLVEGNTQAVRMNGGCCHNMCMIACGRMDAYYEGRDSTYGPKPWDWAAAALIVQEAGGWVGGFQGQPLDIFSGCGVAAASNSLRDELLSVLDGN